MSKQPKQNVPIVDVQKENASNEANKEPQQTVEQPKEKTQEELKADLLCYLSPPCLPEAIQNADAKQIEKAEKTLKDFGFSFPLGGMLQTFKDMAIAQQRTAQVIVKMAEQTGKATAFVSQIEAKQAEYNATMQKRAETEKAFIETHPEIKQTNQQAPPKMGFDLSQIMPLIQEGLKNLNAPQAPATGMLNFAEIGQKFVQNALEQAMNPTPSALEEIGKQVIQQAVPKIAAQIATKA